MDSSAEILPSYQLIDPSKLRQVLYAKPVTLIKGSSGTVANNTNTPTIFSVKYKFAIAADFAHALHVVRNSISNEWILISRLEGLTSAIKIALGPSMAICDVKGKVIGIECSLPAKLSFEINSFQHGQTNTCTIEYKRPRYTVDSPDPLDLRTNITVKKETPFSESPELCTTVEIEEHYRGPWFDMLAVLMASSGFPDEDYYIKYFLANLEKTGEAIGQRILYPEPVTSTNHARHDDYDAHHENESCQNLIQIEDW